jgi:hypothetical protein
VCAPLFRYRAPLVVYSKGKSQEIAMARVEHRPNPQQSKAVLVSEQDEQIIRACLRYQFMTVSDFCAVLGMPTSHSYLRRVLSRLAGSKDQTQGHYLYKFALPKTRSGNATLVYVPGYQSRELLAQWGDAEGMTWNSPARMQNYSYSYVYHNLAVSRLAICATLFCREHPSYTLAELRLWHEMTGRPPRVSLGAEGEQTSVSAIPDCWVYLQRVADGRGPGLWFEVDNATTFRQTFLRRVRARLALFESAVYAEYFGTAAVVPCFAILGKSPALAKARLKNLLQWTNDFLVKEGWKEWAAKFRFAVIDYELLYEEHNQLFTQPLWSVPGSTTLLPLLPPSPTTGEPHGHTTTAAHATHTHHC